MDNWVKLENKLMKFAWKYIRNGRRKIAAYDTILWNVMFIIKIVESKVEMMKEK